MRVVASLALACASLLVLVEACSSSEPPTVPGAGTPQATEATEPPEREAGPATVADAGPCPPQDPGDPYCSALEARCVQCVSSMRPCEVDNLATCGTASRVFTAAARAISAKCLAPGCPAKGDEDCLVRELSAAPVSVAQQELAASFCAVCNLDAGGGCADRFFFRTHDGGTTVGPGARVKMLNDGLVAKIGSTCLPLLADAGTSCEGLLFYCANQVMAGAFPPSACADAGK